MPANGTLKVASAAVILAGTMIAAPVPAFAKPGFYNGRHHAAAPRAYRHRGNAGAAAAAGIIGGLALGALAAGSARSAPYYDTYPAYGGGYGGCYVTNQRVYDAWGRPHWQRVQVCD
jgi:hypothetical protein